MRVRLSENGYTKIFEDGRNLSILGSYENDNEVIDFIETGGIIEPYLTQEELLKNEKALKVLNAKKYLNETDFKMTVDYFDTMTTEKQLELINTRESARQFIRDNEV